jgi:hypothetical protein
MLDGIGEAQSQMLEAFGVVQRPGGFGRLMQIAPLDATIGKNRSVWHLSSAGIRR